jgi:hypothetical protein
MPTGLASPIFYNDLASASTGGTVRLVVGEYTSRAPGFVPVAKVQLLTRTSSVLSWFVMASSVLIHLGQRKDEHRLPYEIPARLTPRVPALQGDYALMVSSSRYFRIRR